MILNSDNDSSSALTYLSAKSSFNKMFIVSINQLMLKIVNKISITNRTASKSAITLMKIKKHQFIHCILQTACKPQKNLLF